MRLRPWHPIDGPCPSWLPAGHIIYGRFSPPCGVGVGGEQ